MSPLASLSESLQPRPSWFTISILTLAVSVFEAGAAALRSIEPPDRRQSFRQNGVVRGGLELFNVFLPFAHRSVPLVKPERKENTFLLSHSAVRHSASAESARCKGIPEPILAFRGG
jgi:hypothetical protein